MRLTSSRASGGRPTGRDFHAHHRAKPRRCHPITVAGWTIARHSAHRDHRRETITQNARSIGRSRGRGVARRRIASCWRSTRFSANRIARGRGAASSAPTTAPRIAFKTGDHRPVHRRRHRRIGTLVRVRSPRAHLVDSPRNRVENEFLASTTACSANGRTTAYTPQRPSLTDSQVGAPRERGTLGVDYPRFITRLQARQRHRTVHRKNQCAVREAYEALPDNRYAGNQ